MAASHCMTYLEGSPKHTYTHESTARHHHKSQRHRARCHTTTLHFKRNQFLTASHNTTSRLTSYLGTNAHLRTATLASTASQNASLLIAITAHRNTSQSLLPSPGKTDQFTAVLVSIPAQGMAAPFSPCQQRNPSQVNSPLGSTAVHFIARQHHKPLHHRS